MRISLESRGKREGRKGMAGAGVILQEPQMHTHISMGV